MPQPITTRVRAFAVIAGLAVAAGAAEPATNRPAAWAQPLAVVGVPNLYRVAEGLYRSAQPTAEGMRNLQRLGIKTVVNLRSFHTDRDEIGDAGLQAEHISEKTWHPEQEDAVQFLKIATDPRQAPVLVHCQHGADRTGAMCALYRIAVQGWTREEAIREMTEGGFGFHAVWKNLPAWLEALDIEALKREAGVPHDAGPPVDGRHKKEGG